jgi:hypothetical protein
MAKGRGTPRHDHSGQILLQDRSLADASPRQLLNRFRKQLARCCIRGVMIGAMDGTYEADRGEYQGHIHMLADEGYREALDGLWSYYPTTPTGSAAVVIQQVKPADLASAAGYCLKTYWLSVSAIGRDPASEAKDATTGCCSGANGRPVIRRNRCCSSMGCGGAVTPSSASARRAAPSYSPMAKPPARSMISGQTFAKPHRRRADVAS